jgi:EAL domain-containing protein (putative c-di-GMP-specific phosphodiesterase class I)
MEAKQIARVRAVRARRDGAAVETTLAALKQTAAREDANLMPGLLDAARAHATEGEIIEALRRSSAPTRRPRSSSRSSRASAVRRPRTADPRSASQLSPVASDHPGVDATTTTGAPTERETVEAVLADPTLIRPVFQPIVDLRRSAVQGYEMLARLANDPSGTPPRWLAAAERLGMSNALEASLVAAGITGARAPCRAAPTSPSTSRPAPWSAARCRAVLDAAPGGLEQLVFELTEQHGIEDYDGLATALDGVRAAGGHVAVEDAGAGYESLQHVLRLRPEYVKLDRGLISDAHADPAKLAIIEASACSPGASGPSSSLRASSAAPSRRCSPGSPSRSARATSSAAPGPRWCATCRSPACAR